MLIMLVIGCHEMREICLSIHCCQGRSWVSSEIYWYKDVFEVVVRSRAVAVHARLGTGVGEHVAEFAASISW
jgi:hypothetical protein